jgi:hypothetical protein
MMLVGAAGFSSKSIGGLPGGTHADLGRARGKLKRKRERLNIRRIDHTTTLKSVSAKLLML